YGDGVKPNHENAMAWYRRAAAHGHAAALRRVSQAQSEKSAVSPSSLTTSSEPANSCRARVRRGTEAYNQGDRHRAIHLFQHSLPQGDASRNWEDKQTILSNLGAIFRELGKPAEAIESYDQAIALARRTGNKHWEISSLLGKGTILNEAGENEKALALY